MGVTFVDDPDTFGRTLQCSKVLACLCVSSSCLAVDIVQTETGSPQNVPARKSNATAADRICPDQQVTTSVLHTCRLGCVWGPGLCRCRRWQANNQHGAFCCVLQRARSAVWLQPVPYYTAQGGGPVSFSINLWFKAGNTNGDLFQYLFSHMGLPATDSWSSNQVLPLFYFLHCALSVLASSIWLGASQGLCKESQYATAYHSSATQH